MYKLNKKFYGPFLWMRFNCLKARATLRRQFTGYLEEPYIGLGTQTLANKKNTFYVFFFQLYFNKKYNEVANQ